MKILRHADEFQQESGNHICHYGLISSTPGLEVMEKTLEQGGLMICQVEESKDSLNLYYLVEGCLLNRQNDTQYRAGAQIIIKDLKEALVLEALERSKMIWITEKPIYHELLKENKIVMELLTKIQKKDHYTKEHSLRVAQSAKELAHALGFEGRFISDLVIAALAHDVGKIEIDDQILNKPGKLTKEEYEHIKDHVTIGYEMVSNVLSAEAMEIVLMHHERLDGHGYPKGLHKEAIHPGAKILAIADSYDAMTSDRPYRKSMPHQEALQELKDCQGSHFEPSYVVVFCQLMEEKHEEDR